MAGELKTSVILELVDRISAPVRRVTQALGGMARRAGLDNLRNAARGVQTAMAGALQHTMALGRQAVALGKGLAVAGGAAAAAGWAITRMVGGVATLGNEIKIASERLGVGAGWLQEWQYAAKQYSVDNDALIDGFKELGLRADEFVVTGSGGAADAFKRLGITVKDLRGTAGETEKLLDLVQSRLGKIENDAAKQRIFDELFGGSGGEQMVALLTQSREELDKLRQAARDNGAILSDEDIEQSRVYVRQMNDLTSALQGIKNTVLGSLLPTVNKWLAGLRELSKANRELITQQLLDGIRQFWSGVRAVGNAVSWAADFVGGFGNLIGIVAGLLAAKFLVSLVTTAISLYKLGKVFFLFSASWIPAAITGIKALSLALLTTPIGWIILGITALAGAVYLIYRNWGSIADWFGGMWARIGAFFDRGIGDIAKDLLSFSPAALLLKAVDAVFELFGARPLSELGREWIGGLAGGIAERFGGMWARIRAFFDRGIGDIAKDLLSFSPAALLLKAVDAVFELFGARPLSELGREWIGGLAGGVSERFEQLTRWLRQKVAQLSGMLPDWVSNGLGLERLSAPATRVAEAVARPAANAPVVPALGASVMGGNRPSPLAMAPGRTDVGGELRIKIDAEGRPRVASMKANGGLDYSVESGLLGVVP